MRRCRNLRWVLSTLCTTGCPLFTALKRSDPQILLEAGCSSNAVLLKPVESNSLFKPAVTCASRYSITPNPQLPEPCYSTGACPVESDSLFKPAVTCASGYSITPESQLPALLFHWGGALALLHPTLAGLYSGNDLIQKLDCAMVRKFRAYRRRH